jgi:hypothetical protein
MKVIIASCTLAVAVIVGLYFGLTGLCTSHGHFIITHEGKEIHAVKIVNPGSGRIYFTDRDGADGIVAGTYSVREVRDVE